MTEKQKQMTPKTISQKAEIKEFCKKQNLTEKQFFGKEKMGGSLDLRSLTSIPEGFNPTVGGSLDLRSLTSIPEGFNPTVGGSLYLRSLTSIPEGFNPTVGGSLYLRSLTSIPEGFNPTVGGSLDLRSLTSIPEGFNPTVGGYLYLRSGIRASHKSLNPKHIFSWQNGKYIKVDGILCEVLIKRKNVYKIKVAGKITESYLVTDGNDWAHGETLKKAKEDLHFKIISEKLKKEPIKKDTMITVQHYRLITGACESGCRYWMNTNGISKEKIKAIELLPLLEKTNAYGVDRFKKLITF